MAFVLKDRVKEVTTTTGTGAYSLGGALSTFDTFSSVMSNADTTYYSIAHLTSGTDEWEVGIGTFNTGGTLSRTTILAGSNGTSAVNFSSGDKEIFMTYPSDKAIFKDASGNVSFDAANGVSVGQGAIEIRNNGAQSYVDFFCETNNAHYARLQAPAHSAFSGNVTVTLPATTDTLVGRTTTDTLTNKTLTAPAMTGTTTFGGASGVSISQGAISIKNGGTQSYVDFYCETSNAHYARLQAPAHADFSGNITLTLPAATDTLVGKATTDTLTNKTLTSPVLNTGVSGTAILDEDNMASDSATQLATQQSIKAYVDSQVATANELSELTDTNITSAADGALLFYDADTSKWIDNVVSGDITIADTGVATIAAGAVDNAMLAGSIENAKLTNSSVSFGGVSLALGASDATPAFDLADATNYPTTALTGTITNAQLAGSIENAKLTNSTITVSDGTNSTATALGGTITFAATSNETTVAESSGTVTIGLPSDVTISNDLTVSGNLVVTGNTTQTGSVLTDNNFTGLTNSNSGNATDFGFYGKYVESSTTKYAGLFYDASTDNTFRLFTDTQTVPSTTVDTTATGYAAANLAVNNLTVDGTVDGRDIATDGTKLDGIEASADVTDTTNVVAALTAGTDITIAADGTISFSGSGGGVTVQDEGTALSTDASTLNFVGSGVVASGTGATKTITITDTDTNTTYTAGAGLSLSGTEFTHADTSSQASSDNSGRTYIQDITLDTYGHVTGIATATETVVNTDTNTTYSAGNGLSLSGTTFSMSGSYSGSFTASGNITAYSDERLKENVQTIEGALDKVAQMRGVTYNYKSELHDGQRGTGVIAQEIQQVMPEVVEEGEYLSVAYGNLVGVLIEAVKELKEKVDKCKCGECE